MGFLQYGSYSCIYKHFALVRLVRASAMPLRGGAAL